MWRNNAPIARRPHARLRDKRRWRSPRRFTLIEMLIVIAIIAVLAALLAPALRRSLRIAHSLTCLNNLRQIGVWGLGYASEWHGFLPISSGVSSTNYTYAYGWTDNLRQENLVTGTNQVRGAGILSCHELRSVHGRRMSSLTGTSYGLNDNMGGRKIKKTITKPEQYYPAATMQFLSSKTFWFADGQTFRPKNKNYLSVKDHFFNESSYFKSGGCMNKDNGGEGVNGGPWCWGAPGVNDNFGDPVNPGNGHIGGMEANFLFGDGHGKSVNYFWYYTLKDADKNAFVGAWWYLKK